MIARFSLALSLAALAVPALAQASHRKRRVQL
jgi:hypothetical protein